MPLVNLRNIKVHFGMHLHLEKVNLTVERGERVCLVGRNGAGKSTILRLLTGQIKVDAGNIELQQGLKIAMLPQEVGEHIRGTVEEVITNHLMNSAELSEEDTWRVQVQVNRVISLLQLPREAEFSALSGGLKRRVLLACALANEPDLLLLDEPTNHLDIAAIAWLEDFLTRYQGALLFVTHDRAFLQKLATRILDLDRGTLTSWPCDYQTYLKRKEEALAAEETAWHLFDKKLAEEEVWIRQGIKARRTRNEGRVRALEKLRAERKQRREKIGTAKVQTQVGEQSGKIVIEADNISFSYDNKKIIDSFSTTIMRGDKIGIIGENGAGKTTLLQLLLGIIKPSTGQVQYGTQLSIAYFDQLRSHLDEEKSVVDNVGEGSTTITINGKSKHIMGYLQDFLFTPERARTPVKSLSGGERNRLALAQLFAKPCNVLVMDEPTNDLDMETLDLLEELLIEYQGTLLLVSHDRAFLNNVVTQTFVFEGCGKVQEYVGGYDDWLRQRKNNNTLKTNKEVAASITVPDPVAKTTQKLSYKETRELNELPQIIEKLEAELILRQQEMATSNFYEQPQEKILQAKKLLNNCEEKLANAYARWEELESRK